MDRFWAPAFAMEAICMWITNCESLVWANTRIIRTVNIPSCFHIDYFCQYPDTHSDRWYKTHQSRSCCHQIQFERMAQDVQVLSDKKKKKLYSVHLNGTPTEIYRENIKRKQTEQTPNWLNDWVNMWVSYHHCTLTIIPQQQLEFFQ